MHRTPNGTRWRRFLQPAAALTMGVAAILATIADPVGARPPSTPAAVPSSAFRTVVLPIEQSAQPTMPTASVPDGRLSEYPAPSPAISRTVSDSPSAPAGPVHVVRRGDTLWQIAVSHRASLRLVLRGNGDIDPRRLVAGQRILVPGGRPMPKDRPAAPARSAPAPVAKTRAGRHVWPLPVRGIITTRFSKAHPGIDIAKRAGTPVRAIASGTVTWAGWKTNGGGYVVVVRHRDGMVSTYNHNRRVLVRRGQAVAAGQRIAEVGATGRATGPHLDLRIKMGDRLVDPLRLRWTR